MVMAAEPMSPFVTHRSVALSACVFDHVSLEAVATRSRNTRTHWLKQSVACQLLCRGAPPRGCQSLGHEVKKAIQPKCTIPKFFHVLVIPVVVLQQQLRPHVNPALQQAARYNEQIGAGQKQN